MIVARIDFNKDDSNRNCNSITWRRYVLRIADLSGNAADLDGTRNNATRYRTSNTTNVSCRGHVRELLCRADNVKLRLDKISTVYTSNHQERQEQEATKQHLWIEKLVQPAKQTESIFPVERNPAGTNVGSPSLDLCV